MDLVDFVPFETAKKLKECGFDYPCDYVYCKWFLQDTDVEFLPKEERDGRHICANAPTLWQAQKWLREKKEINVLIGDCACGYYWEVSKAGDEQTRGTMLIYYDGNGEDECSGMWLSYEAALLAGIDAALNLITNKTE